MSELVEVDDIQALAASGLPSLPAARFVPLTFSDREHAQSWLRRLLDAGYIATALGEAPRPEGAVQLALTFSGLALLAPELAAQGPLSSVFVAGMPMRSDYLRDCGDDAPTRWHWGRVEDPLHALLLVYQDEPPFDAFVTQVLGLTEGIGPLDRGPPDSALLWQPGSSSRGAAVEHFGFRDGLSDAIVRGLPHGHVDGSRATGGGGNPIATGELLLGYRNEAGLVVGPTWMKNGTFLVFRQLEQLVGTFWKYMRDHAGPESPDQLAAKLVGRWRSGAPLALCPVAPTEGLEEANDFLYADSDPRGLRCPIGAHIARSNPRDRMVDMPPDRAIALARTRQLVRRGRPYGAPLRADFDFERMTYAELEEAERNESSGPLQGRGLNFICLNANIELQFEFVLHSWAHNPKFGGLEADPDPIFGERRSQSSSYTIPTETLPRHLQLARFVRLRGGGYFFLPGLRTLRLLAAAPPESGRPT